MTVATVSALRIRRLFRASPEDVFAAWTRSDLMARWFAPGTLRAEVLQLDAVPGGAYRVRMRGEDGREHTVSGRFVEVDPPRLLAMSWRWEEDGAYESRVTVRFTSRISEGEPLTEIELVHEGLRDQQAVAAHADGWNGCLDKLPCPAGRATLPS